MKKFFIDFLLVASFLYALVVYEESTDGNQIRLLRSGGRGRKSNGNGGRVGNGGGFSRNGGGRGGNVNGPDRGGGNTGGGESGNGLASKSGGRGGNGKRPNRGGDNTGDGESGNGFAGKNGGRGGNGNGPNRGGGNTGDGESGNGFAGKNGRPGGNGNGPNRGGGIGKKPDRGGGIGGVKKSSDLRAFIQSYPGYTDTTDIPKKGAVGLSFDDTNSNFKMSFGLYNFDPCKKCAIFIHDGTSCDTVDDVGGVYYNGNNPWNTENAWYEVFANFNNSIGQLLLNNGYNETLNEGKIVVVYSQDSTRIGCGVLRSKGCGMDKSNERKFGKLDSGF